MSEKQPGSRSDIEAWRYKENKRRPLNDYNVEGVENREAEVPERLFRQVPVEDLYLLWRDKELPMQWFQSSPHSGVEPNSVGNFWFTQPISFTNIEGYIITEPKRWHESPQYVQKSNMAFKSRTKAAALGEWGDWHPGLTLSYVPEVHTGNRLKANEVVVCLSQSTHDQIEKELSALNRIESVLIDDEARNKAMRRVAKIHKREYGELQTTSDEAHLSQSQRDEKFGEKEIQDPKNLVRLLKFYAWLLELPVIPPHYMPADIEQVEENKNVLQRNEKNFLEFYSQISKPAVIPENINEADEGVK